MRHNEDRTEASPTPHRAPQRLNHKRPEKMKTMKLWQRRLPAGCDCYVIPQNIYESRSNTKSKKTQTYLKLKSDMPCSLSKTQIIQNFF